MRFKSDNKRITFLIVATVLLLSWPQILWADSIGNKRTFFVDPSFDAEGREKVSATLREKGYNLYFYVDDEWWDPLNPNLQSDLKKSMDAVGDDFISVIYPVLTDNFGSEWKLGIDGNKNITVLVHPMRENARGYFRSADEYLRHQAPTSNEREMVYLNADYLNSSLAPSYLAHEFLHLITFNQKNKKYNLEEKVWLNEARAEYAPTLVGYDQDFEGSNLQQRVEQFLRWPSDSLIKWHNKESDYGVTNLFVHYLVEQYGVDILADSLQSEKTGIESLNYALQKNGWEEGFSDVFTNFLIAVFVNDCSVGEKYCFKSQNLKEVKITPKLNFLPLHGSSSLGLSQKTESWAGNWFKFTGGKKGTLNIQFIGNPNYSFSVPYVVQGLSGQKRVGFFELSPKQRGKISVSNFGIQVSSVTIIPSAQAKKEGVEQKPSFFWKAATVAQTKSPEKPEQSEQPESEQPEVPSSDYLQRPISQMSREEIIAKISELTKLINQLKTRLEQFKSKQEIQPEPSFSLSCKRFDKDLHFGMKSEKVKCLQEFLKAQGKEIYPEGLVTGYFGPLTKSAVIRFQEKYKQQILVEPWGITEGTGLVGRTTRAKINQLLSTTNTVTE